MKSVSFTDFRKNASGFISEIEQGETIILLRHGKPIVEMTPISDESSLPSWKQPLVRLELSGNDLSSAILKERETAR